MRQYQPFEVCTREALDFTAATLNHDLSASQKQTLLDAYATLPTFDDAASGLKALKEVGTRLFAFSNGRTIAVEAVLSHAGIRDCFDGVISVDQVSSFKPDPICLPAFY